MLHFVNISYHLEVKLVGIFGTILVYNINLSFFFHCYLAGTVRYIGPAEFGEGVWVGVELRTAKGKNDGSVHDKRYFTCRQDHGLLVRPSKITVRGINGAKLITDYYGSKESSPMEDK